MDNSSQQVIGSRDESNKLNKNKPDTLLLLGLAALALGQALQDNNGFFSGPAIGWLTIALICAGMSVVSQRRQFPSVSHKFFWVVLGTGLVCQVVQLITTFPGNELAHEFLPKLWQFQTCISAGGICAFLSLAPGTWFQLWVRRGLTIAVFLAVFVAGAWVIRASPSPSIDVYMFQQTSSQALVQGLNPYEQIIPNIYGDLRFYGEELVRDSQLTISNPYPPLSIYLSLMGYVLAGDVRYSCLAAILITAVLIILLRPSRETLLAAYIFLFTPRIFLVLELSWTEPLVLLLAVAVVWCAIHHPGWKFIALGCLLASKQYMLFLFPLVALLIPPKSPWRIWAGALGWPAGVAFAVTAPLAFWNFPAFFWNVGMAQWYQIFRMDALSYTVIYARAAGQLPAQILPFLGLGAAFLFIWCFCKRSPAGFASALALALVLFFAFNKQAFCNYYFLILGLLCCAFAAMRGSEDVIDTHHSRPVTSELLTNRNKIWFQLRSVLLQAARLRPDTFILNSRTIRIVLNSQLNTLNDSLG
jgi:hypothetical protein